MQFGLRFVKSSLLNYFVKQLSTLGQLQNDVKEVLSVDNIHKVDHIWMRD